MSELSPGKKRLLETGGHILVLGGPGSGKTYIALLKADREIRSHTALIRQSVLFLSFARATIARVTQQAGLLLSKSVQKGIEMNTYHGFAWNILRSHGYLLKGRNRIRLLPPPEAASRLADVDDSRREEEKRRLFEEEGLLHFDLFAAIAGELLSKSQALTQIICDAYPLIILDEFQDTNADEWQLIRLLGKRSRLIALADAEQRIYEFRGADPKRIGEFITEYKPSQFDFGTENNRSNGTDIVAFGNDVLTGANKGKKYKDVLTTRYQVRKGNALHLDFKLAVLSSIQRLRKLNTNVWSLAILVPTKRLMIEVSDYLMMEQKFGTGARLPPISHEVALETSGPALAAVLIAGLLEGFPTKLEAIQGMIRNLCAHIRGRKGDAPPSQAELELAGALGAYVDSGAIRGPKRKLVVDECTRIVEQRTKLILSGDPSEDWLSIRQMLAESEADCISQVANDAKYLRLLHKGAALRSRLNELWRTNDSYLGAAASVHDALLQEHFSASTTRWSGIHVMTIHKAKGKEFDEVIIYEGAYQGRIVPIKTPERVAQARLALRVAVTRAMKKVTILTPKHDVCIFL